MLLLGSRGEDFLSSKSMLSLPCFNSEVQVFPTYYCSLRHWIHLVGSQKMFKRGSFLSSQMCFPPSQKWACWIWCREFYKLGCLKHRRYGNLRSIITGQLSEELSVEVKEVRGPEFLSWLWVAVGYIHFYSPSFLLTFATVFSKEQTQFRLPAGLEKHNTCFSNPAWLYAFRPAWPEAALKAFTIFSKYLHRLELPVI